MSEIAIQIKSVSKYFILPHQRASTLKSIFVNPFTKYENEKQLALKEVSFDVKKGEFFGIVGRNGSGKSTLLKCIAGVYTPDKGSINVEGSLVPFIELGVGFNPELSGRDNVFLNGALLGFNRPQIEKMYDEIVRFAELDRFMDQKLKNYSSGMQVRLAFSIAIQAKSDILLLDEVLAVGDTEFQQKCFNYFERIKQEGKTVLLVSHDMNALRRFCSHGVLIENGKVVTEGPMDIVLDDYADRINQSSNLVARQAGSDQGKIGSGKMSAAEVTISSGKGRQQTFDDGDKNIVIKAQFIANQDVDSPVYGLTIKDNLGAAVFSSNTLRMNKKTHNLKKGDKQTITWTVPNIFNTGELGVNLAATDENGKEIYDRADNIASFKVQKELTSTALTNPAHEIDVSKL